MTELTDLEDAWQTINNLQDRLGKAERRVRTMAATVTDEGLNAMAMKAAREIEDEFAVGGRGRAARLTSIQTIIRETIREALIGERHWDPGHDFSQREAALRAGP